MKKLIILLWLVVHLTSYVNRPVGYRYHCFGQDFDSTRIDTVSSILGMETYNKYPLVRVMVVTDTLRGGIFYKSSVGTLDSGTVFNALGGGYWVRQFDRSRPIPVTWFGAVSSTAGFGSPDATHPFAMALRYDSLRGGGKLLVGYGIFLLDSIAIPSRCGLIGISPPASQIKLNFHANKNLVGLSWSGTYQTSLENLTLNGNGAQQDSSWCRCIYYNNDFGGSGYNHYWNNLLIESAAGTGVEINGADGYSSYEEVIISKSGSKSVGISGNHTQGSGAIINSYDGLFTNWQSGYNAGSGFRITNSDNSLVNCGAGGNGSGDSLNAFGVYAGKYITEIRLNSFFAQANQAHGIYFDRCYNCLISGSGSSLNGSNNTFSGGTTGFLYQSAYYLNGSKFCNISGTAYGPSSCSGQPSGNTSWALVLNGGDHNTVNLCAEFMNIGALLDIANNRSQNTINIQATDTINSCANNDGTDCSFPTVNADWSIISSGTSSTIPTGYTKTLFNPSSILPNYTLKFPANPSDGQSESIYFGKAIASGTVVTSLTISPNTGQTIVQQTAPASGVAGQAYKYKYNLSLATWFRDQ